MSAVPGGEHVPAHRFGAYVVRCAAPSDEDALRVMLEAARPEDIRFRFFSSTDMEIRLRVLEGRRSRLQERLDRVQRELAMTQKEVDRYATELQRHGVESVEREVRWLSDLINAERGSQGPALGPQAAAATDND